VTTPQVVTEPLTSDAIFLVVTVNPDDESRDVVRSLCADLAGLVRAVSARDPGGRLSCIAAFGSEAWDRLFGAPRPAELHVLPEIGAAPRVSVSTPGDVLFHIRAERKDLCFELAQQIMFRVHGAVTPVDEVHGFRYFDDRDLIGFVDGTENPVGQEAVDATIVGDEDVVFVGGSYVLVQKYVHELDKWNAVATEEQERIIGRAKLSDIELDDEVKPTNAHNALTVIEEDGEEIDILRRNMPFGTVTDGDSGTYFIGYARSPRVLEQMLENMFVGRPPGNYDRLLDFTHPVTGTNFFAPAATFLDAIGAAS
jgi:putative iron-dependent peroxidase